MNTDELAKKLKEFKQHSWVISQGAGHLWSMWGYRDGKEHRPDPYIPTHPALAKMYVDAFIDGLVQHSKMYPPRDFYNGEQIS